MKEGFIMNKYLQTDTYYRQNESCKYKTNIISIVLGGETID